LLLGVEFHTHGFWSMIGEIPMQIPNAEPKVVFIAISCLIAVFWLASLKKARLLQTIPPQVLAVAFGLFLSVAIGLGSPHLIALPENPLTGITFPNFSGVFSTPGLWWSLIVSIVTINAIDGPEALFTVKAADSVDPHHRTSDLNRALRANGWLNIISASIGGLTTIHGWVKTKANVMAGGTTLWANFWNAAFLILYLFCGHRVVNRLPLSALGAIIVFTGYQLCAPRIWKEAARHGACHLAVVLTTVVVSLCSDLPYGIAAGMAIHWVTRLVAPEPRPHLHAQAD
jgi:MFS superfamily sulfate permease-like transporter